MSAEGSVGRGEKANRVGLKPRTNSRGLGPEERSRSAPTAVPSMGIHLSRREVVQEPLVLFDP